MELNGKVALITGAASGFGEAMAHRFAERGAKVVIVDLDLEKGEKVAADIGGGKAIAVRADVSKRADIDAVVAKAIETFGVPDIVINNAGYTHKNQAALEVDEETFDRVLSVNIKGIYQMVQAVVPAMRDNGGGVMLNVGSVSGIRPRPGLSWYAGSKGATNVLSKALAVEFAPMNIRVNAIAPVMGVTGMLEDFMGMPDTPENRAKYMESIPLGRLCQPDDVAEAALYLATADYITGVELPVDGGRSV
ncbi:SDR family oxidoreductase [Croceicoccus mobilis]|uniref:Alcohol dehydrogenase n=1 Tax=Croceicoccus mobilis TaxID=1703339 RepID=A0A916YUG7_9SPHN|nr:SDR family oxidoreductase [Croceicoccus mobilis]GGD60943.1 alcohol dehydrogenase [Croceicoccus mobilis]